MTTRGEMLLLYDHGPINLLVRVYDGVLIATTRFISQMVAFKKSQGPDKQNKNNNGIPITD
jgi:hypothetical protein